jgi:glycosyltransferase involved in cell wall biosynthesis
LHRDGSRLVTIGLPVYNGEQFLAAAIDSFLGQSYGHFELIISDNASTDRTQELCRQYAAVDSRIRYFRNELNIGPRRNFNGLVAHARGDYFKWAAHDDVYAPDFLKKCVQALDNDGSAALSYTRVLLIDAEGAPLANRRYPLDTSRTRPYQRFAETLWIDLGSPAIFGVIRLNVLLKTPLMGYTHAADQVLLGELALRGPFIEIPEELHLHREHEHRSVRDNPTRQTLAVWWVYGRGSDRVALPLWRRLYEQTLTICRVPLPWSERFRSAFQLCRWIRYHWKEMAQDLTFLLKRRPGRQ